MGGGATSAKVLESEIDLQQHFTVAIADSDKHYSGAEKLGHGKGYKYPHEYGGYVKQQYLPDNLYADKVRYYEPTENGSEASFKKFIEGLRKL